MTAVLPDHSTYLAAVPASALFADRSYQSDVDTDRATQIAGHLDIALLGGLEVSARDGGGYAILDGQHRWAAVLQARGDDTHLVCHVHTGLTAHDEARLVHDIDSRRATWSWWDRWKAQRSEGDSRTLTIDESLARYHLRIDPAPREGHVRATKAVETIVADLGGYGMLDQVLAVLTAAFGRNTDGLDGALLQGTALVLGRYGADLDIDRLVTRLQTLPPRQLRTRAQALRQTHRCTVVRLCAAIIVEQYNGGRGRNLDPFLDRAPSTTTDSAPMPSAMAGTDRPSRRERHRPATGSAATAGHVEPDDDDLDNLDDLDDPPMAAIPDPCAVRRAFSNGHGIRRVMDDFSLDYATVTQFREQLTTTLITGAAHQRINSTRTTR